MTDPFSVTIFHNANCAARHLARKGHDGGYGFGAQNQQSSPIGLPGGVGATGARSDPSVARRSGSASTMRSPRYRAKTISSAPPWWVCNCRPNVLRAACSSAGGVYPCP